MGALRSSLPQALRSRGVSRREFVQFCKLMVATLAIPPRYLSAVEKALTQCHA
jgi:hydrogenase small subunit